MAKCAILCTWIIRLFQLCWGFVIMGVTAYMASELKRGGYNIIAEVFVPLLFSVLAFFTSLWSLIAICCLPPFLQYFAAVLDFAILAGYLASAVLLAHNFHINAAKNPLRNWLVWVRKERGEDSLHFGRSASLVLLLDAGVVIMIFLYFITTLLSCTVAIQSSRKHKDTYVAAERGETVHDTTSSGYDTRSGYDSRSGYDTHDTRDTYDTTESSYVEEEGRGQRGYRR